MISVCDRVENIGEKGENASHQHFLLFPQCFPKLSVSMSLKLDCMVEFKSLYTASIKHQKPLKEADLCERRTSA